jgi:hypothetical protein
MAAVAAGAGLMAIALTIAQPGSAQEWEPGSDGAPFPPVAGIIASMDTDHGPGGFCFVGERLQVRFQIAAIDPRRFYGGYAYFRLVDRLADGRTQILGQAPLLPGNYGFTGTVTPPTGTESFRLDVWLPAGGWAPVAETSIKAYYGHYHDGLQCGRDELLGYYHPPSCIDFARKETACFKVSDVAPHHPYAELWACVHDGP